MPQIEHLSPRYHQWNDFIEAMVKAEESDSDPHLAMLIYRATPIRPGQLSPGELFTQQKYRVLLPVHQYLHPSLEISREAKIAQTQAQLDSQAVSGLAANSECPFPVTPFETDLA